MVAPAHPLRGLKHAARPLQTSSRATGWNDLLDRMNHARIVCIGEASHGTEEFYRIRAQLTQQPQTWPSDEVPETFPSAI